MIVYVDIWVRLAQLVMELQIDQNLVKSCEKFVVILVKILQIKNELNKSDNLIYNQLM